MIMLPLPHISLGVELVTLLGLAQVALQCNVRCVNVFRAGSPHRAAASSICAISRKSGSGMLPNFCSARSCDTLPTV